jgi:hypothetical protein
MTYRIFIGDVDRQDLIHLACQLCHDFTIHQSVGDNRGQAVKSIILEVTDGQETAVEQLMHEIRRLTSIRNIASSPNT